MASKYNPTDLDRRIVAHLRRLLDPDNKKDYRFPSAYAMAISAELDPSTFSKIFSGKRGVGIDTLVALHDKLPVSADLLLDSVSQEEMENALAGLRPDRNRPEEAQADSGATPTQQATAKAGAVQTIVGRKTARIHKPATKKRRNPATKS